MKAILPLISIGLMLHATAQVTEHPLPVPCEKEGKVIPRFVTRENYTFAGSTLLAKYPDGLLFKVGTVAPPVNRPHAALQDCVVMVPEESLPEAVRKAVGGFNGAAAAAARKQREQALEAGNKEAFSKNVTGGWTVEWYPSASGNPFGDKPGQAQSWEEYQAALAKREGEKKAEETKNAEVAEKNRLAIENPAGTEWIWASGGKLELREDGSARHSLWKKSGSWVKTPDGKLVLTNESKSFTITFDAAGVGQVLGGDGKTTQIYFKAKKGGKPERSPGRSQ